MSTADVIPALPAIDGARLWASLETAGEIGRWRSPGVQRLALSDADRQMRDTFCGWCKDAGLRVTVDRMGNIFARRPGATSETADPVMVGSHLDTQVAGGRYDGVLGVLAGLEVVRWLDEHELTTHRPVEVVCWTNEEGARFRPSMLGSAVFAGSLDAAAALAQTDEEGLRVGDELERIGYAGSAEVPGHPPHAYFELHIEQSDSLHRSGLNLGIVTSAYAAQGMTVSLNGQTAHAGATPMRGRHDPLVGAAELIAALDTIARSGGDEMRATATRLHAWPNRTGITAGEAVLTFDYRHATADGLNRMAGELERALHDICERRGLTFAREDEWEFGRGISFDPALAAGARRHAARLGVTTTDMASAAGHDAYWLATIAPTLILFVPCVDGITHNEHEAIEPERVLPGVNVLAATVLEAAGQ
jgi:N-carbamoyl-L-amino-acid hydrolase